MRPEDHPGQYAPHLENKTMGENYVEFQKSTLYWVQCGQQALHVRRHKVLIVSFSLPAMTDEEFFGEQLINNIAQFLAIPVAKVCLTACCRSLACSFICLPCLLLSPHSSYQVSPINIPR